MDAVGYDEASLPRHRNRISRICRTVGLSTAAPHVYFLPISALEGDNVVRPSRNMPWFEGPDSAGVSRDGSGSPPYPRHRVSFSGAARDPAGSRLPGLCRTSGFRHRSSGRWHSGAAFRPALAREEHRNVRRPSGRSRGADVGDTDARRRSGYQPRRHAGLGAEAARRGAPVRRQRGVDERTAARSQPALHPETHHADSARGSEGGPASRQHQDPGA